MYEPYNPGVALIVGDLLHIPGLEIRLPAGTVITGWDGVPKTRIAVEKVQLGKLTVTAPPVPTGSMYQLFFGTPMGGVPSSPIPVTLPNDVGAEPGDSVNIWFFDGSPMGGSGEWKIAGQGIVSADGTTVRMPDGTGIPRFCGVCGLMCPERPPTSAFGRTAKGVQGPRLETVGHGDTPVSKTPAQLSADDGGRKPRGQAWIERWINRPREHDDADSRGNRRAVRCLISRAQPG